MDNKDMKKIKVPTVKRTWRREYRDLRFCIFDYRDIPWENAISIEEATAWKRMRDYIKYLDYRKELKKIRTV